jgi:hypothetical protein
MLSSKLYQNFFQMQPFPDKYQNTAAGYRKFSSSFPLLRTQINQLSHNLIFFTSQSCILASNVTLPEGRAGFTWETLRAV